MKLFNVGLKVHGIGTYFSIVADDAELAIDGAKKVAALQAKKTRVNAKLTYVSEVSQVDYIVEGTL